MVTIDGVENMSNNGSTSIDVEKGKNSSAKRKGKQFDIVGGRCYIKHSFNGSGIMKSLSCKSALEAMMKDWKFLEFNLPDSIYVRGYEERIDLVEAMIIGSCQTPYHHGLFFFDMELPHDYPNSRPCVHYKYHLSGFGLNPNINPWFGSLTNYSTWNPESYTILDVLLYLQGLLCQKPYYSISRGHNYSEEASQNYDYNFKDIVEQHFRTNRDVILRACDVYSADGRQVQKKMLNIYSQLDAAFNGPLICSLKLKLSFLKFIECNIGLLIYSALCFVLFTLIMTILIKYVLKM